MNFKKAYEWPISNLNISKITERNEIFKIYSERSDLVLLQNPKFSCF